MKLLHTLFLILISLSTFSQRISHCTIYNEYRENFTVYLNGEKKNDIPSDRVRMINLDQPYYTLKIVFQDITIQPIEKKYFKMSDSYGSPVDVSYAIRKNKNGVWSLNWKWQTIFPDYINPNAPTPSSVSGQPVQPESGGMSEATAQNINNTSAATITGTSCTGTVLSQSDFSNVIRSMAARSSEDGRLLSAKQFVSTNCVNVIQIKNIMKLFSADDKKVEIAKFAYSNAVDKGNYYKLHEEFFFEVSIDDLNKAILK